MGIIATVFYIVVCVLLFALAILVHEFGHFVVALSLGLRVEAFSIGFGKAIWKKRIRGVEYRLSCLPLGGYVSIPDVDPEGTKALEGEPGGAAAKSAPIPPWKEIAVAVAGPAMNVVLAVVLAVVLSLAPGAKFGTTEPVVDMIPDGTPAAKAGFMPGDRVVSVNGREVNTWTDLQTEVQITGGKEAVFMVERGEAMVALPTTPERDQVTGALFIGAVNTNSCGATAWMPARNPVRQLAWDAGRDENAIAREFFTAVYGKAAPLMIRYWEELEKCEAEETNFLRVFPDQRDTLQYLTPENLNRWEAMFDEMEKLAADSPELLTKVRIARMTLDEAVIAVYYKFPADAKPDVAKIEARWNSAFAAEMKRLNAPAWVAKYRGMAMELYLGFIRAKPLPAEFVRKNAGSKIKRLLPARLVNHKYSATRRKHGWRNDGQAAFGFSFKRGTPLDGKPLEMTDLGVYCNGSIGLENGSNSLWVKPYNKKSISVETLAANGPGYHLYYLGRTMLWPDCRLTFYQIVPGLHAPAGVAYDPARPRAEFDIYISLRYDPADGGTVFCDQVVAVELDTDCPKMQDFSR